MKKVLAVIGSPRKGVTLDAVQLFEKKLKMHGNIDFKYIFLHNETLHTCKGCLLCIKNGEEYCPLEKDSVEGILNQMMDADGIIFASPVYAIQVTSIMKNLLDRLSYIFHRPCFFHKAFIPIVSQGVYGAKDVLSYLEEVGKFWGFNVVHGVGVTKPPKKRTLKEQKKIEENMTKASKDFYKKLIGNKSPSPSFRDLLIFRALRTAKPYGSETLPSDYEYFKKKGWMQSDYYYDVKLNPIKKIFGILIDKWIAKKEEKTKRELEGL